MTQPELYTKLIGDVAYRNVEPTKEHFKAMAWALSKIIARFNDNTIVTRDHLGRIENQESSR